MQVLPLIEVEYITFTEMLFRLGLLSVHDFTGDKSVANGK